MILLAAGPVPPLDPGPGEARRWLITELGRPEYQAARPSWFDLVAKAVRDWFASLHLTGQGPSGLLVAAAVVIAVGLVLAALLVFGVPRRGRRARGDGRLFPSGPVRDAATLRRRSDALARRGDWAGALEERYRALALALDERTVLVLSPATTARGLAGAAARAFPDEADPLRRACLAFEGSRYSGSAPAEGEYRALEALDARLRGARPRLEDVPAVVS